VERRKIYESWENMRKICNEKNWILKLEKIIRKKYLNKIIYSFKENYNENKLKNEKLKKQEIGCKFLIKSLEKLCVKNLQTNFAKFKEKIRNIARKSNEYAKMQKICLKNLLQITRNRENIIKIRNLNKWRNNVILRKNMENVIEKQKEIEKSNLINKKLLSAKLLFEKINKNIKQKVILKLRNQLKLSKLLSKILQQNSYRNFQLVKNLAINHWRILTYKIRGSIMHKNHTADENCLKIINSISRILYNSYRKFEKNILMIPWYFTYVLHKIVKNVLNQ